MMLLEKFIESGRRLMGGPTSAWAANGEGAVSSADDTEVVPPLINGWRLPTWVAATGLLLGATTTQAQWETITYTLEDGWSAIYLHGDATHATIEELFPAGTNVKAVWRWNPNPNPMQIGTSSVLPVAGTAEWSVWTRDEADVDTLDTMSGQAAYLIERDDPGNAATQVIITQKTLPPRYSWVRNGANLLGFPTRDNGFYPTFANYFATFPVAIASNSKIFRYVGGELGPGNPIQVFSTATEPVDRTKAYWFEAPVVGTFYAPIEVTPSRLDGLVFGRTGSLVSVRLRNRTSAVVNVTVSTANSAVAPTGQPAVTGPVPLTRREFDSGAGSYVFNPVTGDIPVTIGPQETVELSFGVDRSQITGANDALYASLLRITDGTLMDVFLPVSAQVSSMAGLWVGTAEVSNVQSHVPNATGTTTARSFPLRMILHVDNGGTARLLSEVFIGPLASNPNGIGLSTIESALQQDDKANARRISATHLPPGTVADGSVGTGSVALGQTLTRTVTIGFNAPTNPYVHTYHPDHDNRNARFDALLPAGEESPTISRQMTFEFTNSPPAGTSAAGWGSSVIGGNYTEVLSGLRRAKTSAGAATDTVEVSGAFVLRRANEEGSIATTPAP